MERFTPVRQPIDVICLGLSRKEALHLFQFCRLTGRKVNLCGRVFSLILKLPAFHACSVFGLWRIGIDCEQVNKDRPVDEVRVETPGGDSFEELLGVASDGGAQGRVAASLMGGRRWSPWGRETSLAPRRPRVTCPGNASAGRSGSRSRRVSPVQRILSQRSQINMQPVDAAMTATMIPKPCAFRLSGRPATLIPQRPAISVGGIMTTEKTVRT